MYASINKNFIAYLTSWHNSALVIYKNRLRTIEAENPKKLRIASINSEFNGFCEKKS